jgi:hypothetical protein
MVMVLAPEMERVLEQGREPEKVMEMVTETETETVMVMG